MQRLRAAYRRARPWIPLVAAAAIALGASAAIGLTAIERASKGPAFRVSAACLRLNATVRQELGVVTGFGFTVQGPVVQNADGTGHARLDFSATGSWRSGHVHIHAVERRRRWYLIGPARALRLGRAGAVSDQPRPPEPRFGPRQTALHHPVRTDDLDYDLPPALIAQTPAEPRDSARLLVYDRASGAIRHRHFRDLLDELRPDDLVVLNDTRVLPVRLRAHRATGGAVEVLLLEPEGDGRWQALARPDATAARRRDPDRRRARDHHPATRG